MVISTKSSSNAALILLASTPVGWLMLRLKCPKERSCSQRSFREEAVGDSRKGVPAGLTAATSPRLDLEVRECVELAAGHLFKHGPHVLRALKLHRIVTELVLEEHLDWVRVGDALVPSQVA
jgi:hypothetical protein